MAERRYTGMTPSGRPGRNPMREAVERYKDAADARRSRRLLGSQRDIIKGAEESQGREAREESNMKKGGKVMKHASKAGNAMKRKSADTMGRAMKKYAKGGSIDGCATKGKTKGKMVTMARGGMTGGCK